jgi:hypothetical protein
VLGAIPSPDVETLADVMSGRSDATAKDVIVPTGWAGVDVLPSGSDALAEVGLRRGSEQDPDSRGSGHVDSSRGGRVGSWMLSHRMTHSAQQLGVRAGQTPSMAAATVRCSVRYDQSTSAAISWLLPALPRPDPQRRSPLDQDRSGSCSEPRRRPTASGRSSRVTLA